MMPAWWYEKKGEQVRLAWIYWVIAGEGQGRALFDWHLYVFAKTEFRCMWE